MTVRAKDGYLRLQMALAVVQAITASLIYLRGRCSISEADRRAFTLSPPPLSNEARKTALQEPDRQQHFYGCFCFLRGHNSMLSRGANHSGWITHFCPRLLIQEELRNTVHFKRTLGLPRRISYEQKHDVVALNRKKNARSICTRR